MCFDDWNAREVLSIVVEDVSVRDIRRINRCEVVYTCWLRVWISPVEAWSHSKVIFDAKVLRSKIPAQSHLLPQVFVVDLGVYPHEHGDALVDLALFLSLEKQALRENHQVSVQIVSHFHGVIWLEEHLNEVAEADDEYVQLIDSLCAQCVL